MSSSDIAISVRGLCKSYTIAHEAERHITLAETILARARNPLRRTRKETFWALKDVSFEITQGQVLGVIGRNGAGKSTLLKVLSRITEPTAGEIDIYGRIGSLLEVGTGFHPELTGRENIFLNGAILGMSNSEIRRQFDEIVDFAGVEKFLDTPVKRYSSGMYVRLAFSVAAHLQSDILIVDEVLAVGDSEFQRRCLGKMKNVAGTGRTVIFVSHNLGAVAALCTTALVLHHGRIIVHEKTNQAVQAYLELMSSFRDRPILRSSSGEVELVEIGVTQDGRLTDHVDTRAVARLKVRCRFQVTLKNPRLFVLFKDPSGETLFGTSSVDTTGMPAGEVKAGEYLYEIDIPTNLLKARPTRVTFGVDIRADRVIALYEDALEFSVFDSLGDSESERHNRAGAVAPLLPWRVERADHAGLPLSALAQTTDSTSGPLAKT